MIVAALSVPQDPALHYITLYCVVLYVAPGTVENMLLRWLQAAELTCDRAALLVAQEPADVLCSVSRCAHRAVSCCVSSQVLLKMRWLRAAELTWDQCCTHALLCAVLCCASGTVEDALLRWLRAAELTCDRAALLVAQDQAVVIGALMKLAGGTPAFAHELSVDAFLEQVCTPTLRARTDNMPRIELLLVEEVV